VGEDIKLLQEGRSRNDAVSLLGGKASQSRPVVARCPILSCLSFHLKGGLGDDHIAVDLAVWPD
jgi:hypothetical protein